MRVALLVAFSVVFALPSPSAAQDLGDGWDRIPCVDDPRLGVTLLVKRIATPADEELIGFEIDNRTGAPLRIDDASYRLDDVKRLSLDGAQSGWVSDLASGNDFDLLWRDAAGAPEGHEARQTLVPGVARRLRYCSTYSAAILGTPIGKGVSAAGQVHFQVRLRDHTVLATPPAGLPFRFEWRPPDAEGLNAMRRRLVRTLAEPGDSFHDASLLKRLLDDPDVASAASLENLLGRLRRYDVVVNGYVRDHVDRHFAADDRVIAFVVDAVRRRDRHLIQELSSATRIRDARLVEPLMELVRADAADGSPSHFALVILSRQRDVMPDRTKTLAELGRLTLASCRVLGKGDLGGDEMTLWRWERDVDDLVLTGDRGVVGALVPYLGRTDVQQPPPIHHGLDGSNGVETRACDHAYNAILDLLGRPDERFSMRDFPPGTPRRTPAQEYARRDGLIRRLKEQLAAAPARH